MAGRRGDWAVATFMVGALLAAPVVAWWLIGPLPARGDELTGSHLSPSEYDYTYRPPNISPIAVARAGRIALGVLLVCAAGTATVVARRAADVRWLLIGLCVVAAGMIAGYSERLMTAPVIGADMGAGMVMLIGVPLVLVLLGWSAVTGLRILRPGHDAARIARTAAS